MKATAAVTDLLRESAEWRAFFRECSETGALRLRSQARQFRDELGERGHEDLALADVEDSLLTIARKVLPKTPAAKWDPKWAGELCGDALARISERCAGISSGGMEALDFSDWSRWTERMNAAAVANDPMAYRAALRGWERATIEAIEAATRSGAA